MLEGLTMQLCSRGILELLEQQADHQVPVTGKHNKEVGYSSEVEQDNLEYHKNS